MRDRSTSIAGQLCSTAEQREQANEYRAIRALFPVWMPDPDALVNRIFEDIISGSVDRADVPIGNARSISHGLPGRIQVTEPLARALAGEWKFEDRGLIEVKGQGPMRTFLLKQ